MYHYSKNNTKNTYNSIFNSRVSKIDNSKEVKKSNNSNREKSNSFSSGIQTKAKEKVDRSAKTTMYSKVSPRKHVRIFLNFIS
jgi:hypothetical protein